MTQVVVNRAGAVEAASQIAYDSGAYNGEVMNGERSSRGFRQSMTNSRTAPRYPLTLALSLGGRGDLKRQDLTT